MFKLRKHRIYLDHAAGAPMLRSVMHSVREAERLIGNPSSIHAEGIAAGRALEDARLRCARVLGAHADEIIFTGSGTESDALAITGAVHAWRTIFPGRVPQVITTSIEHPAVIETCRALEKEGVSLIYLDPNKEGYIEPKQVRAALTVDTVLVSIAYANSEIGTVQAVREIVKEVRHFRKIQTGALYPIVHTDACQAGNYLDIDVERLGVDLMSINGTKLGGPKGIGLLFKRRTATIEPLILGGGQEFGLKAGTENLPGIVGLARALRDAEDDKESETERLTHLRDWFIEQFRERFPEGRINGGLTPRLPNNISISLRDFSSELLVVELDARGIAVSAGSACSSASEDGSHVLSALYGAQDSKEWGTVRLSLGRKTEQRDLSAVLTALVSITNKYEKVKIPSAGL